MRRIGIEERRARLGLRHRLAGPAGSVDGLATDMVGLHSSDPATVYLSAWSRLAGFATAHLDDALYDRKSLVRMIGMRRTLFVVSLDVAATMDEACTKALVGRERNRLIRLLEEQGIAAEGHGRALARASGRRDARRAHGPRRSRHTGAHGGRADLGSKFSYGEGKTWAGTMGSRPSCSACSRSRDGSCAAVRSARGRPGPIAGLEPKRGLTRRCPGSTRAAACVDLLGRWLRAFGPATATDIRWWTGWTARLATKTLEAVEAEEVELDDGRGYVLPDDLEMTDDVDPWVALLPALDPTVMGWKDRGWYLGDHASNSSTATGTPGRRCGRTAASSGAGRSWAMAPSSWSCSRRSMPRPVR